jgi:hypothetical protein
LFTDGDAAASVTRIIFRTNPKTPSLHAVPNAVSSGVPVAMTESPASPKHFKSMAPTGGRFAVDEVRIPHDRASSALTHTKAAAFRFSTRSKVNRCVRDHFELSIGASNEGDFGRHGIGLFNVMFSGGRPARTGAHCDYDKNV